MHFTRLAATAVSALAVVVIAGAAAMQVRPGNPTPPDRYKIAVRYYIPAQRDQHVVLYKEMIEHLTRAGLDFQPNLKPFPNTDYEDRTKNILTGVIAAGNALECLRNSSVAALLLAPADFQMPEDPAQRIRVRLELASGFPEARQLVLANQVRALLGQLEFKESVGYDHRGYTGKPHTRIVGTIPAEQLETLLKDLRTQPTGWFAPALEALPAPVSQVVPIIVTEVLSEPAPAADAPRLEKRGQDYLDKISPALWAMLVSKDEDTKIVRAEIILSYVQAADDESYRAALTQEAPSLLIEGRLGPVVTALLRVNQASGLAGLPQVSVVRLARPAMVQVDPAINVLGDNAAALTLSGLGALHQRGFKGRAVRIGIIDTDFRGHEDLVRTGNLPRTTRFLDLTTEFNPDIYPDPQPGDEKSIGHGTHCALAAALASPEAELTLIRIDPASPLQLQLVAKVINGEPALDDQLLRRVDELRGARHALNNWRDELAEERQPILNNFDDDSENKRRYEIIGPVVRGWLFSPREWHNRRMAEYERAAEIQRRVEERFQRFHDELKRLKGIQIVSTSLVWNDGYPMGGGSPLSQWFDQNLDRKALWFVSAGNLRGQAWAGLFRDRDGNGVMEFTDAGAKLPPGRWTPEVNFLAWQPHQAGAEMDLPAGAMVRITAQWNEPHDSSYFWNSKERDRYLKPLADLSLVILRQRDPSGKTVPADDFEVMAQSPVPAFRIENHPGGSCYEQIVEFTAVKAGSYALRVERQLPARWEVRNDPSTGQVALVEVRGWAATGIRPADAASLPGLEPQWELRPRIFASVTAPLQAAKGRVVFRDFWTNEGTMPMLADTRALIAVGAASLGGLPQPYSATGSPGTLWSFPKPNILAFDNLQLTPPGTGSAYGTSLATPFAAGMAAALVSSGQRLPAVEAHLQGLKGVVWRIRQ